MRYFIYLFQISNDAVANILAFDMGAKTLLDAPREHYRPITGESFE